MKKRVYVVEGAVILISLIFIFYFYYLGFFSREIDLAVAIVGGILFFRSISHLKNKYFFQHLILTNLFFIISFVHLLKFFRGVG